MTYTETDRIEALEAEVELLREELAVKCKDCNRHGAFEENVKLTAERDRLREAVGDEKTHSATSDFCSSEWKNDCDELKDIVSRAARIIETVTPGSREEKDEQELWLEDAKAALAEK